MFPALLHQLRAIEAVGIERNALALEALELGYRACVQADEVRPHGVSQIEHTRERIMVKGLQLGQRSGGVERATAVERVAQPVLACDGDKLCQGSWRDKARPQIERIAM